jgi:hypothetical protein
MFWIVQERERAEPSPSGKVAPLPFTYHPTALQAVAETHDTPMSRPAAAPPGSGHSQDEL